MSFPRVKCVLDGKGTESTLRFTADLSGSVGGSFAGTLRRSSRARHVRFIVDERGLIVTMPHTLKVKDVLPGVLEQNLEWILRSLEKVRRRRIAAARGGDPAAVPHEVHLPVLGEMWRVELTEEGRRGTASDGIIRLPGELSRAEALQMLRTWLRLRAKQALPPMLMELAQEHGFTPARVFVKEMRSRWGSCSVRCNVNLNSRLLFLQPDLVRHIMLHELCHLAEMNHSPAFYARLRSLDPEADRHQAELKSAWRCLPPWASEPL